MDPIQVAKTILELAGGAGNITTVTHCATRLRLFVKNKGAVKVEEIKKIKGVLGVVFPTEELQVVLGKNVVPVYTETVKQFEAAGGGSGDAAPATPAEKLTGKAWFSEKVNQLVGFISASVTPLIPGIVAGGMLKVFLLLATLAFPAFESTQSYTLLSFLGDVPFYFMPVFVAYGVAKKMGATPLYAMSVAAVLIYPKFVNIFADGDVALFGLPVMKVTYSSTLLPALLIGIFACYCERILTKIIPGILRTVLVGMGTMALTFVAGVTILGPLGDMVGGVIVHFFLWASSTFGPVAIALLAAAMPFLVMTGMHHAVTPFMVQAFANPGYDVFFRPSYILHNMAEGGACLGVALRTKNPTFRAECLSLSFGCIVAGVTEPALYGVNLRLKKPMFGIMAGGAAGGIVAGILGATAYVYGYSTILALPIFEHTMWAMAIAIAVDIIVAAVVTFILGFEDDPVESEEPAVGTVSTSVQVPDLAIPAIACKAGTVYAPVQGTAIPSEEIPDETFATGVLGRGVGIRPEVGLVVAPFDGTISSTTDTKHAVGIDSADGIELLIHVGVDTVAMQGDGFACFVTEGQKVKAGDKLIAFDKAKIAAAGHSDVVAVLVTNADDYANLTAKTGPCKVLDSVITV